MEEKQQIQFHLKFFLDRTPMALNWCLLMIIGLFLKKNILDIMALGKMRVMYPEVIVNLCGRKALIIELTILSNLY